MDRFTYYAVTDNGTRFLITEANPPNGIVALTLVTNWDGGGEGVEKISFGATCGNRRERPHSAQKVKAGFSCNLSVSRDADVKPLGKPGTLHGINVEQKMSGKLILQLRVGTSTYRNPSM